MTQDEVIEMARQAGGIDITNNYVGVTFWLGTDRSDFFETFAKLIAEKEREACAVVAQETICDTHIPTNINIYGTRAAKAIRARGNT